MAANHGYRLSFFNWMFFALIGIFLTSPFMNLMSDTPFIVESGSSYMRIITIGSLFCIVQMTSEKILQATGNMIVPMICGIIGGVSNIILDPLFIFGIGPFPELGVAGAGVATIGGQFLSMCVGQIVLFKGKHAVKVRLWGWKFKGRIVRDIYAVGAPAILMQSIASIMQFGMNIILGTLTETAVAVMGVYGRLQSFIFMPVFGLNNGMVPIVAYNYGAKKPDRVKKTIKLAIFSAVAIMAVGLAAFELAPGALLSLFDASENMLAIGTPALRIIALSFVLAGFCIISMSVCQAIGNPIYSLVVSVCRQLVVLLPVAWLLSQTGNLTLVWLAFPIAELMSLTLSAIFLRKTLRMAERAMTQSAS